MSSPSAPRRITNEIRTLRFLHGEMTQAELGERIGLTRQTVAAIEAGKYSPSLEAAFRIAEAFGKRLDEVFHWETTVLPDERGQAHLSLSRTARTTSPSGGART